MSDVVYLGGQLVVGQASPHSFQRLYFWIGFAPFQGDSPVYFPFFRINNPHTEEGLMHGYGFVAGEVTAQGVPAGCWVVALNRRDMTLRGAVRSDPVSGEYRLWPLVKSPHLILARDDKTRFNAVIADGVIPAPYEDAP